VLLNHCRFKAVTCGRRWGKTAAGLLATIKGHGPFRGALRGAMDGAYIAWVAPTYTITDGIIWPDLKKATARACRVSEKRRTVYFPSGGMIRVMSTDQEKNLRGPGWDGMVIDEAAFVKEGIWAKELRPSLVDRQGWAIFFTTPDGFNWYEKLYSMAAITEGWARWQRPTSDNPIIPTEELEAARLEMGAKAFAQEHLAQFISQEGTWFDAEYFTEDIWFDDWPTDTVVHDVMSMDPSLGKSDKSDYSAIIFLRRTHDGTLWIDADMERTDATQSAKRAVALARSFNPLAFAIEANAFQIFLCNDIRRLGAAKGYYIPVWEYINTLPKKQRIRGLSPVLAQGRIKLKRGSRGARTLFDQLVGYGVDDYDDGPDALEMAVRLSDKLAAE